MCRSCDIAATAAQKEPTSTNLACAHEEVPTPKLNETTSASASRALSDLLHRVYDAHQKKDGAGSSHHSEERVGEKRLHDSPYVHRKPKADMR